MDKNANPAPGFKSNPDRRITIESFNGIITATFFDAVIASSSRAKVLREGVYAPVFYIPFEDIDFAQLEPSATSTHCPYKGDASYWSTAATGATRQDVMWAYLHPYDEMLAIKDHGAFYSGRVRIETVGS